MMHEEALTPDALSKAFASVLEGVSVPTLEAFAQRRKLLGGGFRRGGSPLLLRALIVNALGAKLTRYDADLATFLREHTPEARLFAMLDAGVLAERRRQFYALFGKARVLLALLADPREAVRAQVSDWMAEHDAELPEAETARSLLEQTFAPVVELREGGNTTKRDRDRDTIADLRRRLDDASKTARRERQDAEAKALAVARECKAQLATAQFNIDERQRTIERLEADLRKAEARRDAQASLLLAEKQSALFQHWLAPACRLDALSKSLATDDLLSRTKSALARQVKRDRASALRADLREKLSTLEALATEVDATLHGALNRDPELIALRKELADALASLHEALDAPEVSPLAQELEARIDAVTEADYEDVLALLNLAGRLALLPKRTLERLHTAFRRRASTWALELEDKDFEASRATDNAIERRNPALTAALRGSEKLILFCDGHNILNGLARYKQRRGDALPHEEARKRVERDLALLVRDLPLVYAYLVWDGPKPDTQTGSDNLTVHYSGGEGEHRADTFILKQLEFCKASGTATPIVLVTDDNGFAGEARKLGANICRLHDFEAFLNAPVR